MRHTLFVVGSGLCIGLTACAHRAKQVNDDPATLRFLVVGDTQGNGQNAGVAECVPELIRDMESRNADFVIFTGDLVGTGSQETLSEWEHLTRSFGERRYMVPGNHDLPGRPATNFDWQELFSWLPASQEVENVVTPEPGDTVRGIDQMDYWFDPAPDVRIVSVTTDRDALPGEPHTYSGGYEIIGGGPRAMEWFQSVMAMESTKAKRWLFVMTHHPVTFPSPSTRRPSGRSATSHWTTSCLPSATPTAPASTARGCASSRRRSRTTLTPFRMRTTVASN